MAGSPKKAAKAPAKKAAAKSKPKGKSTPKPKATVTPVVPEEDVNEEARAAALANLAASGDADGESSVGGTDDPALRVPPTLTGVVHEWGGETDHVVVASNYHHTPEEGHIQTARQGDVVRVPDPSRGLSLGVLAKLADVEAAMEAAATAAEAEILDADLVDDDSDD